LTPASVVDHIQFPPSLEVGEERLVGAGGMISKAVVLAGVFLIVGAASPALARDPPFLGNWARGDGKTRIRVERCGAAFCGINTWVRRGVSGEKVGDRLIVNVKPAGPARWTGDAFDPQRRARYSMKIHVAEGRMTTDGCMLGGLVCQSMSWTRPGRPK
jgi:uncharacterized protein (DUF2147 family)